MSSPPERDQANLLGFVADDGTLVHRYPQPEGDAIDDILAVPQIVHNANVARLRAMRLVLEDVNGQLERTRDKLQAVPNRRTAGGGGL